jgi:membrane carboxypeptidase/penicillin-binding protein PbpC
MAARSGRDDEHTSFVLAAQGRGRLAWYVDGKPLGRNVAGDTVWRPADAGFYEVQVVDEAGRDHACPRARA